MNPNEFRTPKGKETISSYDNNLRSSQKKQSVSIWKCLPTESIGEALKNFTINFNGKNLIFIP